jgi:hypothetical protein
MNLKTLGTDYLKTVTIVLFSSDPKSPPEARPSMLHGNMDVRSPVETDPATITVLCSGQFD